MRISSELEPLHHLTVVPEGCKATFFPYSGVSASRWHTATEPTGEKAKG